MVTAVFLFCSYDEDAETTCEKEVASALALCPDSLDGLQTLASLRLSQVRKGEAAKIISSVFDRVSSELVFVLQHVFANGSRQSPAQTLFKLCSSILISFSFASSFCRYRTFARW